MFFKVVLFLLPKIICRQKNFLLYYSTVYGCWSLFRLFFIFSQITKYMRSLIKKPLLKSIFGSMIAIVVISCLLFSFLVWNRKITFFFLWYLDLSVLLNTAKINHRYWPTALQLFCFAVYYIYKIYQMAFFFCNNY